MFKFLRRQQWKKRKWLLLVVVVLGLLGWWWMKRNTPQPVETIKPQVRDIVETLDVSGNVDAHEKASLKFAAASKLTWMPVKEGDSVRKWQAIAAVDSRQLQKQLEYDQNLHGIQFRTSEGVFDANNIYGAQGLTDAQRRTVESSQLTMRNTALAVEIQDISVKNATMVSPMDGIVTKIDQPNVGALVLPTDSVSIVNPNSLYFAVIVDEADIGKIQASQAAQLTLDAFIDKQMESYVEHIAFTPSQSQSGGLGYKVDLTLPASEISNLIRLGMSGDARIILDGKKGVLSIPTDSIVERQGVQSVEVKRNSVIEKVTIKTGVSDGDFTEVLSGLTQSDDVVMPSPAGK